MEISKTEGWALGGVAALHILLIGALSYIRTAPEPLPPPPPMAVDIVAEIAPAAAAPELSQAEPAPVLGAPEAPPAPPIAEAVPAPPEPAPPIAAPPPPTPKVEPNRERERAAERRRMEAEAATRREREREAAERQRTERAAAERQRTERERAARAERERTERAAADRQRAERERTVRAEADRRARAERERRAREAEAARNRPGGDPLGDIASRVRNSQGRTPNPPATQTAAQVRQSIAVAVDREIAPFWQRNVPSGIDVEQLRVTLEIRLNRNGSIASVAQVGELGGRTESNAPQQRLFVERAIRSVQQAGPFALPAEHYDQWAVVRQTFRATR